MLKTIYVIFLSLLVSTNSWALQKHRSEHSAEEAAESPEQEDEGGVNGQDGDIDDEGGPSDGDLDDDSEGSPTPKALSRAVSTQDAQDDETDNENEKPRRRTLFKQHGIKESLNSNSEK